MALSVRSAVFVARAVAGACAGSGSSAPSGVRTLRTHTGAREPLVASLPTPTPRMFGRGAFRIGIEAGSKGPVDDAEVRMPVRVAKS